MCDCEKAWKVSEKEFRAWLDKEKLNYIWIDQSPNCQARSFGANKIKRPDLFVWPDSSSGAMIAIDVKDHEVNWEKSPAKGSLQIPFFWMGLSEDVVPLKAFQDLTQVPVWLVFKDKMKFGTATKLKTIWRILRVPDPDNESTQGGQNFMKVYANKANAPLLRSAAHLKMLTLNQSNESDRPSDSLNHSLKPIGASVSFNA